MMNQRPMFPSRFSFLLALLTAALGCTAPDEAGTGDVLALADGIPSGGTNVLGTIHAEIDGEPRAWYIVEGSVRGEPYASALFVRSEDELLVTLGGFDTRNPPLDSFETNLAGGNQSLGDYQGSAINLMIVIPNEQTTFRADLRGLESTSVVSYMPLASTEDVLAGTLFARSGTIVIERAEFDESAGSLSGTFSGELALMEGSNAMVLTNGRFEVGGIPSR